MSVEQNFQIGLGVLHFLVALYVGVSGWNREMRSVGGWAVAALLLGLLVVPFFRAFRPLKSSEVREGGRPYLILRDYARMVILFLIAVALASCAILTGTGPQGTSEAADAANAARLLGSWAVYICLLPFGFIVWLIPRMFKGDQVVEGPTGPLAE